MAKSPEKIDVSIEVAGHTRKYIFVFEYATKLSIEETARLQHRLDKFILGDTVAIALTPEFKHVEYIDVPYYTIRAGGNANLEDID